MCNGNNHDPGCNCGFGAEGSYSSHVGRFGEGLTYSPITSLFCESSIWETTCPVCHERVYFYRSPFDGRVFFDEIGYPWPKHPCTDSSNCGARSIERLVALDSNVFENGRLRFSREGWDLFVVESVYGIDDEIHTWMNSEFGLDLPLRTSFHCRGDVIRIRRKRTVKVLTRSGGVKDSPEQLEFNIRRAVFELPNCAKIPTWLFPGKIGCLRQTTGPDGKSVFESFEIIGIEVKVHSLPIVVKFVGRR